MNQFSWRFVFVFSFLLVIGFFLSPVVNSQQDVGQNEYFRAKVVRIEFEGDQDVTDPTSGAVIDSKFVQKLTVIPIEGSLQNQQLEVEFSRQRASFTEYQKIRVGETITIIKTPSQNENGEATAAYFVDDKYRLDKVIVLIFGFFILTILVTGLRGITSIGALFLGIFGITYWVIPQITGGFNPFLISVFAAIILGLITIYVAHGINKKSTVALVSVFITIGISALLALFFVEFSKLFGLGDENTLFLQSYDKAVINLRGLLLGGIVIGTLGVLDDVTIAQSAAIEELHLTDPNLGFWELVKKGMNIGKEHIASMVNTLAFAYVGASFPMLITFAITEQGKPLWVVFNSEIILEEVVRTLVGSSSLVLAVPISTLLAAYFLAGKKITSQEFFARFKPKTQNSSPDKNDILTKLQSTDPVSSDTQVPEQKRLNW